MDRTARLTFKRLTGPAAEPVTPNEAKAWARIDLDDDDTLITSLISQARELCETLTHRQFITATYALLMDRFPSAFNSELYRLTERREGTDILLPRPPLISVQSIVYTDANSVSQTLDAATYVVSAYDEPGRIALAYQQLWPDTLPQINAVRVSYTAGYGPAASDVPAGIKLGIMMLVAYWYENREAVLVGSMSKEMELGLRNVLRQFTVPELWSGSLE